MTTVNTDARSLTAVNFCPHCRKPLPDGSSAVFCSQTCRTLNNRAKWQAAGGAVLMALRKLTAHTPSQAQIEEALEAAGSVRRAALLKALGLTWDRETKTWR